MKRFSEQFKKQSETIRLGAAEKDVLRTRVTAYMEYHPLPTTQSAPVRATALREPFIMWSMPNRVARGLFAVCTICLVVGVPALAERAVPGDLLYPMKVRVNEEVVSSLTGAGYEKVVWETKRLERRIAEARVLAKEGRLTSAIEADVIAAVSSHQASTEAEIATLRTTDADAAALAELTFASVLDVQSATLRAQETGSTTEGQSTVALALALDEAQAKVAGNGEAPVSYERLVAQLEQETTRGRELLASIEGSATEQEYKDIERRLSDIERKVADGMSMSGTDGDVAIESLKATWRDMQVVITFMTDIDVRSALALEALVPMVLTPDEERALAHLAYAEAEAQVLRIESALPQVTDTAVTDKVAATLPMVQALLTTATTSIASDVRSARQSAEEAREFTRSIVALPSFAVVTTGDEMMATMMTTATSSGTSTATTTEELLLDAATSTEESI